DDELATQFVGQLVEGAMANGARLTLVDEKPRRVASLGRMLRDQLRRQVVIELRKVHPTRVLSSAPWTWTQSRARNSESRTRPPAGPIPPPSTRRWNERDTPWNRSRPPRPASRRPCPRRS